MLSVLRSMECDDEVDAKPPWIERRRVDKLLILIGTMAGETVQFIRR